MQGRIQRPRPIPIFEPMSGIRRQSIISTVVIYAGFLVGLLNTYLFTRNGLFTKDQFGLYNVLIAVATLMGNISALAMPTFLYKFYPYYKSHLPDKKNDQAALALVVALIGFVLVLVGGIALKELVVRKYETNSPQFVHYYAWVFPLTFGLVLYIVLEAYTWQIRRSVFTNFLKELLWRLYTSVLILLYASGVLKSFGTFIICFSFSFLFIALILFGYLIRSGQLHLHFRISRVTRRFAKTILRLCLFVFGGSAILILSQVFDSLVIASVLDNAMDQVAVYTLGQNLAIVIQVPQRGIVSSSIAHLSQAWKDKNMGLIQRIYERSSINQLIFACFLYGLLLLNFTDAVETFKLQEGYRKAFDVILLLGLCKIVDMGTGVNAQIIATSTWWRFEMISGIILLIVMLPASYILTKQYGIAGTAAAQLAAISIYNLVRILFLWFKFRLFPFTRWTPVVVVLAIAALAACWYGIPAGNGLLSMFLRSALFTLLFAGSVILLKASPDVNPVMDAVKKRFSRK